MSQSLGPKSRTYYALIADPPGTGLLMVKQGAAWEPPCWRTTQNELFGGAAFSERIKRRTGLDVWQLRVAQVQLDPVDRRWEWALIAMECDGGAPVGGEWIDRAKLNELPLTRPELRAGICLWLDEQASGSAPAERPMWSRPGWRAALNEWVAAELAAQNIRLIEPLEQRKVWSISTLLRGQTSAGSVYIKGCPTLPLFTNEAAITAELALLFPANIPPPLAVNRQRRLMMLKDFGGQLLCDSPREAWNTSVDVFAELQLATVNRLDELLGAGCLNRRLPQLAAAIPTLAVDVPRFSSLNAAELSEFDKLLPRLEKSCAELAVAGVPDTLAHGDLHDHNIAIVDAQPVFFDWSDACIAHPFFDLPTLSLSEFVEFAPDEWESIRDRYLSHWTAYAALDDLRRIAQLASALGNLHQVLSYLSIVSNLEPSSRWELARGLDDFARQLLVEARELFE